MKSFLLILSLLLGACQRQAVVTSLDPTDPCAAFKAYFMDWGNGRGKILADLPTGEQLQGSYRPVYQPFKIFARNYRHLYPLGGPLHQNERAVFTAIPDAARGIATLIGTRGTRFVCEYITDQSNGHGTGICQSEQGTLYRIRF